jgi:hypothetical protein
MNSSWGLLLLLRLSLRDRKCEVDINADLGDRQPLYITPGTESFYYPTLSDGIMRFNRGDRLELHCDSGFRSPLGITGNTIIIKCFSRTMFDYNYQLYSIGTFECNQWPKPTLKRKKSCYRNGIYVETGFEVGNRWFNVYTTCFDPVKEVSYYSYQEVTRAAVGGARSVNRPSWSQGDFFPMKNVDYLYTKNVQRSTIAGILGSTILAGIVIEDSPSSSIYLARGHLSAMSDFVFANEQRATFYFTNAAPQFQSFNNGNWKQVEISSRKLAADRNIVLRIFTGTHDILQYENTTNIMNDIHLDSKNKQIPAPKIFYKILLDPASRQGVVLIGVNNPHISISQIQSQDYIVCKDVSSKITYINWKTTDLYSGYSYACEVDDFFQAVPHRPIGWISRLLI